jgi:hypothetical protein
MAAARSRIATALGAVAVLVAVCVGGDHGTARAAVGQATGPLIGSSLAGAAIFDVSDLAPGHGRVGEITVTNVGDVSGAFALGTSGLVNTPLGRKLDLVVEDVTPGHSALTVYYGKLAALSTVGLGNMAEGEAHRYRFTVGLTGDVDNSYQGSATAVSFVWSATGEEPGEAPGEAAAPAPVTTAPKPPKATTSGGTKQAPTATLTARARQQGTGGAISASVVCSSGCRVALSGTAAVGGTRVKLGTTRRTLRNPARVEVRIVLPAETRRALAGRHPVVVRLVLRATVGTHVVVVHRTVRITPAPR